MAIVSEISIKKLKKLYKLLDRVIKEAANEFERMGAIQCFEMSFELAWKTIRKTLIDLGKDPLNSPRNVFRDAGQIKLIDDPEKWFEFLEYRKETVHSYNEAVAQEIISILPVFKIEFNELILRLEKMQ
jgi:nucleotidyltransferase substrate binding protein (TIGR01987 family)